MSEHKSTVRLFFTIEIEASVSEAVEDLAQRLQKAARFTPARISWVPPGNRLVTLFFLGETPLEDAQELASDLETATTGIEPFELDVRKLDFFPADGVSPPKVLWVGIHNPPDGLIRLRNNCAKLLERKKIAIPGGDFTPHITLARLKSTRGLNPLRKQFEAYRFVKLGKYEVTRLVLMQSTPGEKFAVYSPYATAPLESSKE